MRGGSSKGLYFLRDDLPRPFHIGPHVLTLLQVDVDDGLQQATFYSYAPKEVARR